jgi:Ca2+-binding RTX toxin-like protein
MNNTTKFTAAMESLESRRMMDATSFYMIYGTPGNDVISVTKALPVFQMRAAGTTRSSPARTSGFHFGGIFEPVTTSNSVKITVNGTSWTADVPSTQRIRIDAGDGNDLIKVNGSRGMDLMGRGGNDTLVGGDGDDLLAGGDGTDTVDYSARMSTVILTCDNRADDGRGSEHDNILSDCEVMIGGQGDDYIAAWGISYIGRTIYGNLGNDKLFGSNANDVIIGGRGNDYIDAGNGLDYVSAGDGNDTVHGGADRDVIAGDAGNDVMYADSGADAVFGSDGNDRLYSGRDNDELLGGRGRDILVSLGGGQRDVLNGGSDVDFFWLDSESTETIPDYDFYTESKNYQRISRFDNLHVNGQDKGAPSRELGGDYLADPTAVFNYRSFRGYPLFSDAGPQPADIKQGSWVGDCYWLAGLSAIARISPDVLRRSIVDLGDGTFAVRFLDGPAGSQQVKHYIRLDADLSTYGDGTPAYAGLGAQNSLWAAILEKAWAYYRAGDGKYASINQGDPGETYKTFGLVWNNTYSTNATTMAASLQQLLSQGKAVTVSTKSGTTAVVEKHVYMVDGVYTDSAGNTQVRLRNPWGTDGPGTTTADGNNDGYVTISAAMLFNSITKIESATVA